MQPLLSMPKELAWTSLQFTSDGCANQMDFCYGWWAYFELLFLVFFFPFLDFGLVNTLQTLANGLSFTLLGGLPLTPCSMKKLVGFFKQCQKCRSKLPPLDGYSLCLPCLGETHRVDSCPHGARFLKQARKNQVARMQIVLTTAALTALMSSLVPSQDRVITHHLDTKAALGLWGKKAFGFNLSCSPQQKCKRSLTVERRKRRQSGLRRWLTFILRQHQGKRAPV